MIVAVPTKDRPGSLPLTLLSLAFTLDPHHHTLIIYDDGNRPATADYPTRFAIDVATRRGIAVNLVRGVAQGIHKARARIIKAAATGLLLMVDDDIVIPPNTLEHLTLTLTEHNDAQYVVPTIRLANNEAGIDNFNHGTHHQQFQHNRHGVERMNGGAWTCTILIDLDTIEPKEVAQRLAQGPPVVEDYNLTTPLTGYINYEATVWHNMTPDQGERAWNSEALAYLRNQLNQPH